MPRMADKSYLTPGREEVPADLTEGRQASRLLEESAILAVVDRPAEGLEGGSRQRLFWEVQLAFLTGVVQETTPRLNIKVLEVEPVQLGLELVPHPLLPGAEVRS